MNVTEEQHVCMQFCFKQRKNELELLKQAFGYKTKPRKHVLNDFNVLGEKMISMKSTAKTPVKMIETMVLISEIISKYK